MCPTRAEYISQRHYGTKCILDAAYIYTESVIISGVATKPTYVLSDFWALIVVELELSKRRTSEIYRKYGIFISRRVPNLSDIRSPSLLEAGWRDHMAVKL